MGSADKRHLGDSLSHEGSGLPGNGFILFFLGCNIRIGKDGLLEHAAAGKLFAFRFLDFLLLGHPGFQLFFVRFRLFFFLLQLFPAYLFDVGHAVAADFPVAGRFIRCLFCGFSRCRGGSRFHRFRVHLDGAHALAGACSRFMAAQVDVLAAGDFFRCIHRRCQSHGSQDCQRQTPPVYLILHRVPPSSGSIFSP